MKRWTFGWVVLCVGAGFGSELWGADPPPAAPPVLATVDDLAAEVERLKAMLQAMGVDIESPAPAAEREAIQTLQKAGYDVRPMDEAQRLAIARQAQDERLAAERAEEDRQLAQRIAAAIDRLTAAGYVINQISDAPDEAIAEDDPAPAPPDQLPPDPEDQVDQVAYSADQLQLLAITTTRNASLTQHPALMDSAQRLAEYHAQSGRWAHSSRSWRGSDKSENIAWNTSGVSELGAQWIRSRKGHRQNWDGSWTWTGVGVARNGSRVYGVQHFSRAESPHWAQGTPVLVSGRRVVTRQRRGLFWRLRRRR